MICNSLKYKLRTHEPHTQHLKAIVLIFLNKRITKQVLQQFKFMRTFHLTFASVWIDLPAVPL